MSDALTAALVGAVALVLGTGLTMFVQVWTEARRARHERESRLFLARQELYSRFVSHVRALIRRLDSLREHVGYALDEVETEGHSVEELNAWNKEVGQLVAELSLTASPDVVHEAITLRTALFMLVAFRERHHESGVLYEAPRTPDDEDYDLAEEAELADLRGNDSAVEEEYRAAYVACINAMRRDLGSTELAIAPSR